MNLRRRSDRRTQGRALSESVGWSGPGKLYQSGTRPFAGIRGRRVRLYRVALRRRARVASGPARGAGQIGRPVVLVGQHIEKSVRDEAERKLAQARATWEDVKKGKRPSEIEALQAQLKQARAASTLSEREFKRQQGLIGVPGAAVELDFDRARSSRDQTRQRMAELEAELRTAQLGSRSDQIIAAGAEVRAREAALAKAEWELSQKRQKAPKAGLVFDTLYREGEWVAAGRPVVVVAAPAEYQSAHLCAGDSGWHEFNPVALSASG